MIKKCEIFNFQSHKKTILEFVAGTNVIIGESDAGKSAVFRAINWVISNRPLGDAFRSEWGGDTKVSLHTIQGDVIERIKSANKNEYIINGESLKAFGSEVPAEVTKILQMDSFNTQAQTDLPFLLSLSAGEAAKILNRAASIDDIDRTIGGLKKAHTDLIRKLNHIEDQVEDYKIAMSRFDNLPEIEKRIIQVEKQEKIKNEKTSQLSNLTNKTETAILLQQKLKSTEPILDLLKQTQETEISFTQWKKEIEELNKIKNLIYRVKKLYNDINTSKETIEQIEEEYDEIAPEICPLCGNKMKG